MVFRKKMHMLIMACASFSLSTLHSENITQEHSNISDTVISDTAQQKQSNFPESTNISPEYQEKINVLVKKFTDQDNLNQYLKQAEHFTSNNFLQPILQATKLTKDAMRSFRDTLLYNIPLEILPPPLNNIGIYTKDVIKVFLFGILLAHEHALLTYYTQYVAQQLADHLITILAKTTQNKPSIKDILQLGTLTPEHLAQLTPAHMSSLHLHARALVPSACMMRHIQHIILQQFVNAIKQHYLIHEEQPLTLFSQQPATHTSPLPLFSILQETILLEIPLNIPDATIIHLITNSLKQYGLLPTISNSLSLTMTKDIVLNLLFLHHFTTQEIIPRWHNFLKHNGKKLSTAALENPKELTNLIRRYLAIKYTTWLKNRHQRLTRWDSYYHGLLLLPILYKWSKWGYLMYKEITQE